jgi:hypothetical protein
MSIADFSRCALGMFTAIAMLAGCGGSQPPIGAPGTMAQSHIATPGSKTYNVTGPLLYVTNYTYNSVTVYHASGKDPAPIATISDGLNAPSGDCLDSHGTLYVTNQPASNGGWVAAYRLGKTEPSMVITKGINTAAFCAIDSNGNLWVTNIGGPNVTEYLYGSKRPHTVITKGVPDPVGIALDHSGNLYVSNRLSSSDVVVYAPGNKTPSRTITDGITSPVGIGIDANGTLYVTNITEKNVEEYLPGGDHPFKTITQGISTPAAVTVNKKGWLYVANASQDTVAEFPPGSTTLSKRRVSKGLHGPSGVALFPPVLP